ncbi:MAG: hypothetical protein R3F22_11250 [Lysobacteraceae bacterium]
MRRLHAQPLLLAGLLVPFVALPATATPIFADGFEACCSVGGTASGLEGRSATLRLSSGALNEDLLVSGDGPFRFSTALAAGVSYSVSITSQPASGAACALGNASGVMPSMPVDAISLSCAGGLLWDSGAWGDSWQ